MRADYEAPMTSGEVYDKRMYSGMLGFVMNDNHKSLEKDYSSDDYFKRVLEIGGGNGRHIDYVKHRYDEYILSDISDVALKMAEEKYKSNNKIKTLKINGACLDIEDNSIDRIISNHVLEHIYRPHEVLREWNRVLKKDGVMSIVIPCDPGMLFRFGRYFFSSKQGKKMGINDYLYHMAKEHVNPCNNLRIFIRYYFDNVKETWFPLRIPLMDINLSVTFQIRK